MDVFERTFTSTHPLHTPTERRAETAVELDELYLPPQNALLAFATLTRAGATVSLTLPVVVGMVLAWWSFGTFQMVSFFFALIGALMTAAGFTMLTEYFDFRRGSEIDETGRLEPCVGSYCLIIHGLFPSHAIRMLGWLALLLASCCAAALTYTVGWPVLFFFGLQVLIGFVSIFSPLRLAWRGWGVGEIGIFLSFGLLQVLSGYYVQAQSISLTPIWTAIPFGLLTLVVVHNGNLVYYRRDSVGAKAHTCGTPRHPTRVGSQRSAGNLCLCQCGSHRHVDAPAAVGAGSFGSSAGNVGQLFAPPPRVCE